jgi:KAT8 regulatory NSL complex subunit 1
VGEEEEIQQLLIEEDNCLTAGELVEEDITEDTIEVIHEKAQMDERKKFETYLKFPLTSRSRANRRINSRGNESSGANTPTPDATSPAPHQGDTEVSI